MVPPVNRQLDFEVVPLGINMNASKHMIFL